MGLKKGVKREGHATAGKDFAQALAPHLSALPIHFRIIEDEGLPKVERSEII
jgi:hypothetical protein